MTRSLSTATRLTKSEKCALASLVDKLLIVSSVQPREVSGEPAALRLSINRHSVDSPTAPIAADSSLLLLPAFGTLCGLEGCRRFDKMSQRSVEILLGRLVTDEEIRHRFRSDPEAVFAEARTLGLELTEVEIDALRALDLRAVDRLARALDPRIQKVSLQTPFQRTGGHRRARR
jgi:hypothetical protein